MAGEERRPSVAIIGTRGYPSYYGGFETAVRHLAPYLVDAGWDVTVYGRRGAVVHDDPARDPRVKSVEVRGIESKSLSTLSSGFFAARAALAAKHDVALVMNVANGFWLPLLRRAGVPTVVNVDGIEWLRDKWGRVAKRVFISGAKLTARYGDELIFDAQAIGEYWRTHFHRDGTFIPYGGLEPRKLPVPEGLTHGNYALMVARLVPENSVGEFLDAVPTIAQTMPVVVVGSSGYGGELEERLADLAVSHPNVTWMGHVRDDTLLEALWQHCGVYFHGHSVGGTNPALVQAMACAAPVVARDTVFNREVLADCGVFTKPDASAIATAVVELGSDVARRRELGDRAAARAREAYSWDAICAAYAALLHSASQSGARV